MGSFRKRLLVLIIGLGVVTQTVTLAAVLISTRRTVEARAAEQLRSGGSLAEQLIGFRAGQLANGVAVLAADFGFREAVASGDAPTILSAARNNAQRIGADMVLLLDTHGRVLTSTAPAAAEAAGSLASLIGDMSSVRDRPNFRVFGAHAYQFFLAPVRTPETIAWVAMGFVADEALAQKIRDLVGSQVAILTHGSDGIVRVAATLPAAQRSAAASPAGALPAPSDLPHITRLQDTQYLSFARRLDARGDAVDLILLKPLQEVLAPYRDLRDAMLLIDGIALILAAVIGAVLGRSATRPIGELMRAARRIEQGQYETAVSVSGGEEFRRLAATFNAMQSNIAAREADITHHAYHDPLTQLPNRALVTRQLESLVSGTEGPSSAALVLIELRNLRDINASLGHQVGDEVLREASRRLKHNTAAADTVARLGETQLLVIVPGCSAERSLLYAEQLVAVTRSGFHLAGVALVRWTHPQLGAVSPAEFVPLAESTGGSRRLTNWVLAAAVRQMGEWRRMGLEVDLAVNLSAPDILDPDLCDAILQLLRQHRVDSTSLLLEITESAVMHDPQVAVRNMQLLRIAGVRFSIDDFGTGHSSLSQL